MNAIEMLVKSISLAAANATYSPGVLQPWVDEIESKVSTDGKFSKMSALYLPFSPPPVFWDYKCKKCLWWRDPNGCATVEGEISSQGWCAIWVPPKGYKMLTWPKELFGGDW